MHEESDEMINTEEPIEISEEERTIVLKSLEKANKGEGLVSYEDALLYFDKIKQRVINRSHQEKLLKVGS